MYLLYLTVSGRIMLVATPTASVFTVMSAKYSLLGISMMSDISYLNDARNLNIYVNNMTIY